MVREGRDGGEAREEEMWEAEEGEGVEPQAMADGSVSRYLV